MMLDELEKYGKKHPMITLIYGGLMVVFLGLTDHLTGSELAFSIFYLIPITLVIVMAGRFKGLMISVLTAIVWLIADLTAGHVYTNMMIPYWNTIVILGYFILHTFLLSTLLKTIQNEKEKSLQDPLTNAANWRFFKEYAHRELERNRRERKPVTLAYFDLDNFKQVNDTLGHDVGNELLQVVSGTIQSFMRSSDMLARVGGDEFVIFLPEADYSGASTVLFRIRSAVLSQMEKYNWPVTLSIGAITYNTLPPSVEPMVKRVDELMYSVKNRGKNNLNHESWPPDHISQS